ncbi:MAG: ACT domain-containing protein [Limnochordia bacterium]|jgi:hypothetical protein
MKLKQVSVFLENKTGRLSSVIRTLADAGINITTLTLADTQQFGILRMIIDDWEKAKAVLEEAGAVVKVTDVLALEVKDRPGGLAEILNIAHDVGVGVEYMYAFTVKANEHAVLIFRFDDVDKAIEALCTHGVHLISPAQLFESPCP